MFRKLSLVLILLIFLMAAFCLPTIAEPQDDESDVSSSFIQEDDGSSSDEETSSYVSKYYIPDDSTYFTESLNSLGGNVTSGSIILDVSGTSPNSSTAPAPQYVQRFSLQDVLKRFLWIPIVIIIICILVLIIFNKIYELKYKHIDPKVLLKEQKKADQLKREARRRSQEDENSRY